MKCKGKNHGLLLVEKAWEKNGINYVKVDSRIYIDLAWVLKTIDEILKKTK